jgi:hypothetical protein
MSDYDCVVVFPYGLVSSGDENQNLALIANGLEVDSPIICPAQITYYTQDLPCQNQCIFILPRNPEYIATDTVEVVNSVFNVCKNINWINVAIIAHPNDQNNCKFLLSEKGLQVTLITAFSPIIQD